MGKHEISSVFGEGGLGRFVADRGGVKAGEGFERGFCRGSGAADDFC